MTQDDLIAPLTNEVFMLQKNSFPERQRVLAVARSANDDQTDGGIERQIDALTAFANRHHLTIVGTIVLRGVAGFEAKWLHDLILRKTEKDDYDAILLTEPSRLTRGPAPQACCLLDTLRKKGIQVIFAQDGQVLNPCEHTGPSPFEFIDRSINSMMHRELSEMLSRAARRGMIESFKNGRIPPCPVPPYGIDRLIQTADGEPLVVLRNQPDGSQQLIDPATQRVVRILRRTRKWVATGYRKQPSELITLIPGSPEAVKIVREIFSWHFKHHWGSPRIAAELNTHKVIAPKARYWSAASVRRILGNPLYAGVGIFCRISRGILYERGPLQTGTRPPSRIRRPRSEWLFARFPALEDAFIDADMRAKVLALQLAKLSRPRVRP